MQTLKQIERKTPEILHFYFLLSCSVASVISYTYLSENEAKNLQNGDLHLLLKFLNLKSDMSRTIWSAEITDGLLLFNFSIFQLSLTYILTESALGHVKSTLVS